MVACTYSYTHLVKECSYIIGVGALYIEGDDSCLTLQIMCTIDGDTA